jgi:hypothetical protein
VKFLISIKGKTMKKMINKNISKNLEVNILEDGLINNRIR